MMSRRWDNLIKQLVAALFALMLANVCLADVAVVVHPDNPMSELSKHQVKKLFLGRLRMLPNTGLEADVVDQSEDQPSFSDFYSKLVKMGPAKLKRYRAAYLFSGKGKLPLKLEGDAQVKAHVASHHSAIGYIESSLVDESVKVVYVLKL